MNDLERSLREAELPDEVAARERARRTVLAAHTQAAPRRRVRASLVWIAVAVMAVAIVVSQRDSGPAQALERAWRAAVDKPAPPKPVSGLELPAAGRLLVTERGTLYVVERSGKRQRVGTWADATWSPKGLFIGATAAKTLAAIEPDGDVRWKLTRPDPVSVPRWAPDGTHIAYRSGATLRIVYGNGLHDVLAGRRMAPVAPAWRPSDRHTLAWAATDGTVTVEDADTAKVLWTVRSGPVRRLAWSADGRTLLVAGERAYTLAGDTRRRIRLPAGSGLVGATFAPRGDRLALARFDGRQTVVSIDGQVALSGPGALRDLEWSPDGRRLLAGWPGADHWLVIRATTNAVAAVRHHFGTGGHIRGWISS
jgi:hypothetical protein